MMMNIFFSKVLMSVCGSSLSSSFDSLRYVCVVSLLELTSTYFSFSISLMNLNVAN